mmetsp:Transcript_41205/g.124554  ORF Transcript_41205/g.124554 Transcript_41205/m.124554 type:complete len:87 (+) Transcript_41205:673-933(+)
MGRHSQFKTSPYSSLLSVLSQTPFVKKLFFIPKEDEEVEKYDRHTLHITATIRWPSAHLSSFLMSTLSFDATSLRDFAFRPSEGRA